MATVRYRRQWRFYKTAAGNSPVDNDLDGLVLTDKAAIAAAMKEVRDLGRNCPDVNHLKKDIWQIEIDGDRVIYRLLFAEEGRYGQVLLALVLLNKKTQKTPPRSIDLAERRLGDWRARAKK
jgi:phage-related protein